MPRISGIQIRHDTAANWTSVNPTLLLGEIGYESDTAASKVGDGSTVWTALAYAVPAGLASSLTALRTQVNALLAPYGLTATGGSGSVTLAWSMIGAAGSLATDYTVQYRTTAGPGAWTTFAHTASAALVQTVTGLTTGTSYDFRVASVSATTSAYSATVTASPSPYLPNAYLGDTFNRANTSTSLGSTDGGSGAAQSWTATQHYFYIASAAARSSYAGVNFAVVPVPSSSGTTQVTLASVDPSGNGGICFRSQSGGAGAYFIYSSGVYQCTVSASVTTISGSPVPAAGDVLKVVDNGTVASYYLNGTLLQTATVTVVAQAYSSLYLYGAGTAPAGSFKNWSYSTATS